MEDIIGPEKPDQKTAIPDDEEIIELTDTIESNEKLEEGAIELTDVIEDSAEPEETVIELDNVVEDPSESGDGVIELTEIAESTAPEPAASMESIDEEDMVEKPSVAPAVTSEQVNAAIERVVRDMLSEKIDSILVQVIEKEVSREIERLKGLLMDEQ